MDEVKTIDSDVLMEYQTYEEFKTALDGAMNQAAGAFVTIGYLLKKARDTEVLYNSGYKDLYEFAEKEYQLHKDQVSRFIAINDRFSINGYGIELKPEMKNFGVAKLSELLTLPDEIVEAIPPEMTRQEIQEIKKDIKEEQKITDIEVMFEKKANMPDTIAGQLLHQYFYDKRNKFTNLVNDDKVTPESILFALASSGVGSVRARVSGVGTLMMTLAGSDKDVTVLNVRQPSEKVTLSIAELKDLVVTQYNIPDSMVNPEDTLKTIWQNYYGEAFQNSPKPIQNDVATEKIEPKKEENGSKSDKTEENNTVKTTNEDKTKEQSKKEPDTPQLEKQQVEVKAAEQAVEPKEIEVEAVVVSDEFEKYDNLHNKVYKASYEEYGDIVFAGIKKFIIAKSGEAKANEGIEIVYADTHKVFLVTYVEELPNGYSIYGLNRHEEDE